MLVVGILPAASSYGAYAGAPDLLQIVLTPAAADVATDALSFGDPYNAGWDQFGQVVHWLSVDYSVGTATASPLFGLVYVDEPLVAFAADAIRPIVGPVQSFAINGFSAFSELTGVSTTPTLSWTAPSVGTANGYVVTVYRLADVGGSTQFRIAAVFYTAQTSIDIPPGIMEALGNYVFTVTAFSDPTGSVETAPFQHGLGGGSSDTFSEKMLP